MIIILLIYAIEQISSTSAWQVSEIYYIFDMQLNSMIQAFSYVAEVLEAKKT